MEKSNEKENSDTDSSVVSSSDDEIPIAEITGDDDTLIFNDDIDRITAIGLLYITSTSTSTSTLHLHTLHRY